MIEYEIEKGTVEDHAAMLDAMDDFYNSKESCDYFKKPSSLYEAILL